MILSARSATTRRGLAMIETAIVLPLVLLLTMGLIEYGWLFLKAQQITNAARQGARVGARADASNLDIQDAVTGAMTLAGMEGSGYQLLIAPTDIALLETGQMLTVTVRVNYDSVGLGLPLIPTPGMLESAVVMGREGS